MGQLSEPRDFSQAAFLPNWLGRRAVDRPDTPAVIVGRRTWTYAELDAAAGALAQALAAQGISEGNRVAVLLRNGSHFVCAVHALIRLGAVLLPLNVRLAPAELAWQMQHAGVKLVLHDANTVSLARAAYLHWDDRTNNRSIPMITPAWIAGEAQAPAVLQLDPPHQDDLLPYHLARPRQTEPAGARVQMQEHIRLDAIHSLLYTSGTTGRPKGVLLSYSNHWWAAVGSALNLGLQAEDRWLACLPLFHVGGLSILLRAAIYGIPVVFPERSEASFDPQAVNHAITASRSTIISVVSAQLQRMLDAGLAGADTGGTLRCVLLGGGPAPLPLLEECARRSIPVVQSYGLTETCSQAATLAPYEALQRLGSAGRPLLPTEVRIAPLVQEQTPPAESENAAVGEILVRGPTVTSGYLLPDRTEPVPAVDADGWLHTGDIGYLDREGYLYVLDRRTDLIISGGENIYPAEVEATLLAHPAVADAGVYPLPHPVWGQQVAAAVVLYPEIQAAPETLIAFARERLARYKVPAHLEIRSALPRNAAGKLVRRELARAAGHTIDLSHVEASERQGVEEPTMQTSLAIQPEEFAQRRAQLAAALHERELAGAVLFDNYYILYYCGFAFAPTERPIAFLLSADGEAALFVPRLELEHAHTKTHFKHIYDYVEYPADPHPMQVLAKALIDLGIQGALGADADGYPWIFGYRGPSLSETAGQPVHRINALVEDQLAIKSPAEIALIRESAKWGNLAHRLLQRYTVVGAAENAVSLRASQEATLALYDTLGHLYAAQSTYGEGASAGYRGQIGRNAAIPHTLSNNIVFQKGDILVTGAGAPFFGYNSELERTMVIGEPSDEQRHMFEHMQAVQEVAFKAIQSGARCSDVDRAVHAYYERHDLMQYWRHHSGHAIGLRYHEGPFLDRGDHTEIRPGMVFTVEPGLYAPHLGGFRHSDTVVVTEQGIEQITYYPRDLESLTLPA